MLGKCVDLINKIWLYIKFCLSKLNQAIQWTKQYWFFQLIALFLLPIFILLIFGAVHDTYCYLFTNYLQEDPEIVATVCVVLLYSLLFLLYFFIIPITILIFVINFLLKKEQSIKNTFLLYNKYYNLYYLLIYFVLLFGWILFW